MNRLLLAVACVTLFSSAVIPVHADSSDSKLAPATELQRVQIEKKRDEISGADRVAEPVVEGASELLDVPVETSDAPEQSQQP